MYTLLYSVHCTVIRRQSGWLSWQILWGSTSSLLPVNYNLHYTVHCTKHVKVQHTVHYIGHCSVPHTVHCALHYTLQRHKRRHWNITINWTKQGTFFFILISFCIGIKFVCTLQSTVQYTVQCTQQCLVQGILGKLPYLRNHVIWF